ncbi:TenA family protein [Paenibacillus sp. TRM 82003]|uniref:TenA family protein n=1 Tax=Kineococcus sp. TRM81007 TaxID=2925831 RepID=UPI001F58B844|nr:TenA family protein [Kineococcus sp. TRM81007]MCI2238643.1 TenA family protein [Kineococcus sp. TRM81007]MCI3927305.1 TenA family protein [Paenibacillus sp. TRM 82003]
MSFTDEAWARTAHLRTAIDECRFLRELGDGTLDPGVFRHYLEQDEIYLAGYGRALALLASRAPDVASAAFWASSAHGAAVVESALHGDLLTSGALPPADGPAHASPTTLGYVSHLVATAATAPYPVAAAAVLPCFWVYADVARRLARSAAAVLDAGAQHPYARWVAAYDAEEFHASVATARRLVDEAAAGPGGGEVVHEAVHEAMHEAFATATRYEFLFWETALHREDWPLPLVDPAPA